jgi:hypothetical protein
MTDWSPTEARERAEQVEERHVMRLWADVHECCAYCSGSDYWINWPCVTLIEARDVIEALGEVERLRGYRSWEEVARHFGVTPAEARASALDPAPVGRCDAFADGCECGDMKLRKAEEEVARLQGAVRWAAKYDAREYRALAVSLMVVAIMTVMLVLEAIR